MKCADPYPDIIFRWSKFPLARDWLLECPTCTGPVLITDVRDAYFQLNPFGVGRPGGSPMTKTRGLQVYQETPKQTTQAWLTVEPIFSCKGIQFDEPMLCSRTTTGTRAAMLKYLEVMYGEMKLWVEDVENCYSKLAGLVSATDQAIHNYLYYTGQLPFATSIRNRHGIVHTVGVEAAGIHIDHINSLLQKGFSKEDGTLCLCAKC